MDFWITFAIVFIAGVVYSVLKSRSKRGVRLAKIRARLLEIRNEVVDHPERVESLYAEREVLTKEVELLTGRSRRQLKEDLYWPI